MVGEINVVKYYAADKTRKKTFCLVNFGNVLW